MTILNIVNQKNSQVPVNIISLESNLPPNPVREFVLNKESYENEIIKTNNSATKPSAKKKTTQLKAYGVEFLTPNVEETTENFIISVENCNNLLGAIQIAANKRYPFVFTPEIIWYTILEGASIHMNIHPEFRVELNEKTSSANEQKQYVKENKEAELDWLSIINTIGEVYKQKYQHFTETITSHSRDSEQSSDSYAETTHNPLLTTNGSTNLSAIAMKQCRGLHPTATHNQQQQQKEGSSRVNFKRYVVGLQPYIPQIHIKGSSENYEDIMNKVQQMGTDLDMEWWTHELTSVLAEFVNAAKGKPDPHFWKYMTNLNDKNGLYMPLSGWIQAFFPYIEDGFGNITTNDFIGQWRAGYNEVMPPRVTKYPKKKFPSSYSQTSLHLHFPTTAANQEGGKPPATANTAAPGSDGQVEEATSGGEEEPKVMKLRTGLIAIAQNKNNRAVQPVFGFTLTTQLKTNHSEINNDATVGNEANTNDENVDPVFIPSQKYK